MVKRAVCKTVAYGVVGSSPTLPTNRFVGCAHKPSVKWTVLPIRRAFNKAENEWTIYGAVAQLVERRPEEPGVGSSSLPCPTTK